MMPRCNPWAFNSCKMGGPKLNTLNPIRWSGGGDKTGVPRVSPRSKKTVVMRFESIGEYSKQRVEILVQLLTVGVTFPLRSLSHMEVINRRSGCLFPAARLSSPSNGYAIFGINHI